ncbi:MAG: hypothetical protein LC772_06995 [Chloroflexi bacterium]|nr:hypothetical protein [Chloroflexota bacterium]
MPGLPRAAPRTSGRWIASLAHGAARSLESTVADARARWPGASVLRGRRVCPGRAFLTLFWTLRGGAGAASNPDSPVPVSSTDPNRLSADASGVPVANRGPMMIPPAPVPGGGAPGGTPAANGLAAGGGAAAAVPAAPGGAFPGSTSQASTSQSSPSLAATSTAGTGANGTPGAPGGGAAPPGMTPAGTTLVGKAPAGAAASIDSSAGGASAVQIYWRFATDEYFAQHQTARRGNVPLQDGESASFVRFDVENSGRDSVPVTPDLFTLYAEGTFVQPAVANLPGLFQGANVPPHGAVRGWLLFVKPWWDRGTEKLDSKLSVSGIPGATVTLSDRRGGRSPVARAKAPHSRAPLTP